MKSKLPILGLAAAATILAACATGAGAATPTPHQNLESPALSAPPPATPDAPPATAPATESAGRLPGARPGAGRPSTLSPSATVTFCEPVEGVELLMDIYYPDGHSASSNTPAVVYVHGGGWTAGSRDTGEGSRYIPALVARGYVVFSLDYRLSPDYLFPAHIQDVQCGIRHIRANAATYGIDAGRIGAIGGSAGGQLVDLLGTAEDGDFALVGGYESFSSEVTAVVAMYGASDFSDPNMTGHNANHTRVFGTAEYVDDPSNPLWQASAVNYVDSGDSIFLLLHGEEDPVVPITQSEIFAAALSAAGVDVTFVRVANAGHAFVPVNGTPNPGANQLTQIVVNFFDSHL